MNSVQVPFYDDAFMRTLQSQMTSAGAKYLVGPSPFEVPETIKVCFDSSKKMTFRFVYSNDEMPEESFTNASQDGSVKCRLGKETKKILEVVFLGDIPSLIEHDLDLDGLSFSDPHHYWSRRTRNVFEQNLRVIKAFFSAMPKQVREQLKTAFSEEFKLKRSLAAG